MSIEITLPLSDRILGVISRMDQFRGIWSTGTGVSTDRLAELASAARIQSIAASCRLSGIRLSASEVTQYLASAGDSPTNAGAVRDYSAAMDFRFPDEDRLLGREDLVRINRVVVGEHTNAGTWRTTPSHCEAFDSEGHATGRIIQLLPPRLIPEKLEDLLTWFECEMRSGERHAVPVIGAFILGLMAISPFEFANGRTVRVLTRRLMIRAGYAYMPYSSIEWEMEGLRDVYYDAFDQSQPGLWNGTAEIGPWLEYFTTVLDRHRERVASKIDLERGAAGLSPLQQAILEAVREHGTVDAGLLIRATGANRNTLKDNLRRMVDRGLLEKTGQRRTTRYSLGAEAG